VLKNIISIFRTKPKSNPEGRESPYAKVKVSFDEESAFVQWPDKAAEAICFKDLIGVAVETTDKGPFIEDVWWHLASPEKVVTYPSEATGADKILNRLQQLPTFNNERLIQAMSSTDNKTFILWDKQGRHV